MSVEIQLPELIDSSRLPQHIAIIMDGNGRWAKLQGQNRVFGHKQGAITVREITQACAELGIKYLTLYTFSTENWGRPSFEITALMELLVQMLRSEVKTLRNNNIRLNAIGNLTLLPDRIHRHLGLNQPTFALGDIDQPAQIDGGQENLSPIQPGRPQHRPHPSRAGLIPEMCQQGKTVKDVAASACGHARAP